MTDQEIIQGQPEPTSWLVKAVVWGMAICIPVAILEMVIQTLFWALTENQ